MEWLGDFARDYGVDAMVTDDLSRVQIGGERLGIERQICIARVRNRARSRLDRIEGLDWGNARIWRRLTDLTFDGDLELPRLERAVWHGDATLRRLCVELVRKWRAPLRRRRGDVRVHSRVRRRRVVTPPAGGVPWTNSATERAICGIKMTLNGFGLRRRAWSGRDGLDMSEPVAAQRRDLRNPLQNGQPSLGRLP